MCEYRIITLVDIYNHKNIPCYKGLKFKELLPNLNAFLLFIFLREKIIGRISIIVSFISQSIISVNLTFLGKEK